MDDVRKRVGQVLTDYRDGLLDSLEDGIDAVLEIEPIAARFRLKPYGTISADRDLGDYASKPAPGHSISTRKG
jgi:hypothetical protein